MKAGRWKLGRRGATLVLVTTIGVIVGILAMAMIQLGYHARMLAVRSVQGIAARCAADAGMVEAVFKMQKKLFDEVTWDSSTLPPNVTSQALVNNATYGYTITGSESAGYLINATGTAGIASRTTHIRLEVGSYWEGIGVKDSVDVKLGTNFDVVGGGLPSDMVIRSNATAADRMIFKAFVVVPGDVVCGPGGIPDQVIDVKASTIIQGETYAATKALMFPDVQVPPNLTYMGSLTASATIAGGRFRYDVIDLPNSGILRITGPTVLYVTGKMTLGKSAEVIVESGGSLELYLGTSLEDKNSVGFSNLTDDPRDLKIYGMPACTWIDLKAKSTMAAAVYAPNADLNLYNSGDFYGSMTSYSFEMKNSGNFHFDARLKDVNIDDPAAVFVVGRWWEN